MSETRFFDSHVHLFHADYDADREEVIRRANDAGVASFMVPATDVRTTELALAIASRYDGVSVAAGIHPHDASRAEKGDIERVRDFTREQSVRAIGEIGLDYFYDLSPKDLQRSIFRGQLELAVETGLPAIIHTRDSLDDTISIVSDVVQEHPSWRAGEVPRRGVFHCFTGPAEIAQKVFDLGFYISFPGILTFKRSPVASTFTAVSMDRVLVETDGPYMTPVPHRGKRNEPAYVTYVAQTMADLSGKSLQEVARMTTKNAKHLFERV